jgi:predicted dinucleotide-binding enzyme
MKELNISILGTGAIATALSRRTRHSLRLRGALPGSTSALTLIDALGVTEASKEDFLASDIVFVVVPAASIEQAAAFLNGYQGIVVAVSVSGSVGRDGLPSSAERIATARLRRCGPTSSVSRVRQARPVYSSARTTITRKR